MTKEPIISFKNFTFQYRAQAEPTLNNISLDIFPGEIVCIAGPSGSGKSTIAHCINGLIPESFPGKSEGSFTLDGKDVQTLNISEISKLVGTVLQDTDGQFVALTVGEDIAFAMENDCIEQQQMISKVQSAADLTDMGAFLAMSPHELSGGQKQRVSLAGVLVDDVKILLFDEPLANLDPAAGKQTIELIEDIHKKTDTTIVIIEHRIEDVLWGHVDRVILVDDGKIAADMSPAKLLSSDMLKNKGIREPLYITALKYAGVDIREDMRPDHPSTLILSNEDKKKVNNWYESISIQSTKAKEAPILSVQNLVYGYGTDVKAVDSVSFDIYPGEMVSIVGRNGAGKSTTAKLICGFETPDSGTILFAGRDVSKDNIRIRAQQIGYVMQNPNNMISKSMIRDEVALGISKLGLSDDEIKSRVDETLKVCGLYQFRNWPISALSFGQKKRVTIASILVMGPKIIILDEPTAGQDFRHYTEIMEFLKQLNAQGVTVIMVTHDMHLMLEYTSRALVFNRGHLVADTTPSEVLCDKTLVEQAALKETSLFSLADACGIADPVSFVNRFIKYDRGDRI